MIRNIRIQGVKSFPKNDPLDVPLSHTKRVALFYGNNGAGKSALGQVVHHNGNNQEPYENCTLTHSGEGPYQHLVYNEEFVEKNFRNKEAFPGIFSLGEADAEALRETEEKEAEAERARARRQEIQVERTKSLDFVRTSQELAADATWKAYKDHCDGPLERCLDGYGGSRMKVFDKLAAIALPDDFSPEPLEALHSRMSDVATPQAPRTQVNLDVGGIVEAEVSELWMETLVGSTDSRLEPVIKALGNMDWVSRGAAHIHDDQCPFCQQKLPADFQAELGKLIDHTYRNKLGSIDRLIATYERRIVEVDRDIQSMKSAEPFVPEHPSFSARWTNFHLRLMQNLSSMRRKQHSPSEKVELADCRPEMALLFQAISDINTRIDGFNERIRNRATERQLVDRDFWQRMRHEHAGAISMHVANQTSSATALAALNVEDERIRQILIEIGLRLTEIRANSTGAEKAVEAINQRLRRHGITGFTIAKKEGKGISTAWNALGWGKRITRA